MMSTDCEIVMAQAALGRQTLHHNASQMISNAMASNGNGNTPAGLSYEGKLSLISPYANYGMSIQSALMGDMNAQQIQTSLIQNQISNFLNQAHSETTTAPSVSENQNSNQFFSQGFKHHAIKTERPESPLIQNNENPVHRTESPPAQSNGFPDIIAASPTSTQLSASHYTPDTPKIKETNAEEEHKSQDEEMGSDPLSPYRLSGQDEHSMDSDPEATDTYMDTSFDTNQQSPINHGENPKSLKCQYCSFSTDLELHFHAHVNTHYDHKCLKCEFTANTILELKEHLQSDHEISPDDAEALEGIRIPRMTAQGKVKKFKCKQCDYITITKDDFWNHQRTHIKSEKQLSCKKCSFVTEYKHHLEYHMRNHTGSKPYMCNKCPYSCVNKSMLNSHMKSHSNVYQYRCSDCNYATKYCHSLKLHLRKYRHAPAMVLNPDGSPNPVPIIDVYGTRRGPKLKKDESGMPILPPQYQLQAQFVKAHMKVTGNIPLAPTGVIEKEKSNKSLLPPLFQPSQTTFQNPFANYSSFLPQEFQRPNENRFQPQSEYSEQTKVKEENLNVSKSPEAQEELIKCDTCNFSTPDKNILAHHQLLHRRQETQNREAAHMQIDNKIAPMSSFDSQSMQHSYKPANDFSAANATQAQAQQTMQDFASKSITNPYLYQQLLLNQRYPNPAIEFQQQFFQRLLYESSQDAKNLQVQKETNVPRSPSPTIDRDNFPLALDLSKEQTPPNIVSSSQSVVTPSSDSTSTSSVLTPPPRSRRKGKAFKIERIALRLSGEDSALPDDYEKEGREPEKKLNKELSVDRSKKWVLNDSHECQYCDIIFKDVVLHTMHMGYHGFKDPFTCNHCGYQAANSVDFFVHIARSPHT